jgi:hypothetical protein
MKTEEKTYDTALKLARDYYEDKNCFKYLKGVLENIFPELKESEDERIRKWLIDTIKSVPNDSIEWDVIDKPDVLAWLEKQEQKSKWSENDEHHWMMCVACVEECATQEREDFSKTIDWLKSLKQRMEQ